MTSTTDKTSDQPTEEMSGTVRIGDIARALTDAMQAEAAAKATVARLRTAMTVYGLESAAASGAAPRWDVPHLCTLGIEQWTPTSTPVVTSAADLVTRTEGLGMAPAGFSDTTVILPTERVAELGQLVTAAHCIEMELSDLYMICSVLSDFGDIDQGVIGQLRDLVESAIRLGQMVIDSRSVALTASGAAWCEEHLTVTEIDGVEAVRLLTIDETTGESKIVDTDVPGTTVGHNTPRLVVRLDKKVTSQLKADATSASNAVLAAAGLDTELY
jgi:hypothetical protein